MQKKILTLLVLLMTAATGAWAQEQSETIATTASTVEGTHFTISNGGYYTDGDGMIATGGGITVTPKNGETITKVVITCTYNKDYLNDGNTSVSSGTKEITNRGGTITVTGVNASTFTFTCSTSMPQFRQFVVYYTPAPEYYLVGNITSWGIDPQYKLALNESADDANEYQIALALPAATELKVVSSTDGTTIKDWFPAEGDNKYVENDGLYTIYFRPGYNGPGDWHASCIYVADGVSFTADGTAWTLAQMPACDLEMEVEYYPLATLATTPAAAEGLNDATTADLLTPGTSDEGTLYYALGTSEAPTGQWSQTIPTTQGLEAGEYYVWYKVVGDDQHSDSQPQSIAVTVAQAPAFAVTIDDAGVDASNWQATPAEQRAGQTVTLSYSGKKTVKSITIEAAPITVTWNSSNDTYKIDAVYNLSITAGTGQSANQNLSIADAASLPLTKKLIDMDPNGLTLAQQSFTAASITVSGDNIVLGTEDGWNTQIMFNGAGTATVSYNIMYTKYTMQIGTGSLAFTVTKNEAAEPETPAATTVTVTPTANANEWEFTMPDYAVVAKIEYYTDAELAAEETVILADGDTYTRTLDMTVASATYKKSIAEERVGLHQAWLVPFDYTLTNDDMDAFSFYKINMIANAPNPETEASNDIWVFLKRMNEGEVLHANMPYVYRAKEAVENYEFTTDNAMLKAKETGVRITMMTAEDTYTLYGTYEGTTATAEDPFYYVNIDGDLSLGNDGTVTVGAYRWIMRVESKFGSTPAYARNVHFFDGEDSEATGISEERRVKSEEFATAEGWYSLDGRRVAQPKKGGLYIVRSAGGRLQGKNGRKVVIK